MPILDEPDDGECQLLGPFAIIVQMSLAVLALLALLLKRQREHPRRPFQVWYIFPISSFLFFVDKITGPLMCQNK